MSFNNENLIKVTFNSKLLNNPSASFYDKSLFFTITHFTFL